MALGLDFDIFLVSNILAGLYAARGVKNIKEYAIGDGIKSLRRTNKHKKLKFKKTIVT